MAHVHFSSHEAFGLSEIGGLPFVQETAFTVPEEQSPEFIRLLRAHLNTDLVIRRL